MKKLVIVAFAALLITGCAAEAPQPPTETEAPPEFPATYRSVEELRDAFVEAGGECPSWEQMNHVAAASESGTCSTTNVLSIYTSKDATDSAFEMFKAIAQPDAALLVGDNWIINDPSVKELDPAIGGTFFTN